MKRTSHLELVYGNKWWGKSNIIGKMYKTEQKKRKREKRRKKRTETRRKRKCKILKILGEYPGITFMGILAILRQTNKIVSRPVYRDVLTELKIKDKVYYKKILKNNRLWYIKNGS